MTNKNILVVVDPTADVHPVIDRAAWLAGQLGIGLELCICDYDPDIEAGRTSTVWISQPARENLMSILRQKLEALAQPLRGRGLSVSVDVVWDHPLPESIVRKVVASKPWMVAKDTHHHSKLKRTIFSNTDWHLIRDCPAPLFLVKPHASSDRPKVLAAVDPMHEHDKPAELDQQILELAKGLATGTGGELQVVHTFAVHSALALKDATSEDEIADAVRQEHQAAMTAFLDTHQIPAANSHLLKGAPHDRLPQFAEDENIDILVMGAVSRSGLDRIFIGSTAARVLDRLPCDLVIVKPQGFQPYKSEND
jgi:universal stress protein E